MTIRSNGVKKSLFPAQTSVLSGATFDYVINSTNYKITYENLLTSLGVTGSIVQVGDAGDAPVLDDQGAVKGIRNIEGGFGISTSIGASNSLVVATDFSFNSDNVALVNDVTAAAPAFRSIKAGTGIIVSGATGEIQITASGVPASTKTITVSQLSDFPTPSAGVITLAADTQYLLLDDVDVGVNRFVLGNKSTIAGSGINLTTLTSSTTGVLFTATTSFTLIDIAINASLGTLFSCTGGAFESAFFSRLTINTCVTIGTFTNWYSLFWDQGAAVSFTNPLTMVGACSVIILDLVSFISGYVTAVDLGTATFNTASFIRCGYSNATATNHMIIAANSANINTNFLGRIVSCNFNVGATNIVLNADEGDLRWFKNSNLNLPDTLKDSLSYNTAGVTVVIATINTPVIIGGTWVDDNSNQFTVDGAGTVTYNGNENFHTPVTVAITARPVSGSNKDYTLYIAKNGTPITASGRTGRASSTDKQSVTPIWQIEFATGDTVSVMVENNTDTTDFVVDHAVLRVN